MKLLEIKKKHMQANIRSWQKILKIFWQLNPKLMTTLLLLTIIGGVIPAIQVQITASTIQSTVNAIHGGKTNPLILVAVSFCIAQGALTLLTLFISAVQQYLQQLFQTQLSNKFSIQIMEKAISLDLQHYEDDQFYDKLQRANNESNYRAYQIFTQFIDIATQFVSLVSVASIIFLWNWLICIIILISPLPAVYAQIVYGQKGYRIERERTSERRHIAYLQYLVTNSRAYKEIRLFNLGHLFINRYRDYIQKFYRIDKQLAKQRSLVGVPLSSLGIIISSGSQIYATLFAIMSGNIGLLAGYIQAIGIVQHSALGLLSGLSQLYQHNLFIGNLFEYFDTPSSHIKSGSYPFPPKLQKGIEFRNVNFYYPGTTKKVLDNLSFFLPAEQCVALVGQNGTGKTTIVKLLSRLYQPTSGQILIDDIPIEEYDIDDLQKHLGVIFQDFMQYEMSVKENIGFGYVEDLHNMDRIRQAAERSGAAKDIECLSQDYKTILGRMFEDGQQLSIGQWQKIALARAFMRKAAIVVLDEPTASIDAEAEAEIFGRLYKIAKGTTSLLIAHRFSTTRIADKILVLEDGKVKEEGTHETLMKANQTYAHLFNLQASGYLDQNHINWREVHSSE